MEDVEICKVWSNSIAGLVADALVAANLLQKPALERATAVIAEEIYVRLALGDCPDNKNWRFSSASSELPLSKG